MSAIRKAIDVAATKQGGKGQLAQAIGVKPGAISRWYNGGPQRPALDTLIRLFELADMSLDELSGRDPMSSVKPDQIDRMEAELHEVVTAVRNARLIIEPPHATGFTGSQENTPARPPSKEVLDEAAQVASLDIEDRKAGKHHGRQRLVKGTD